MKYGYSLFLQEYVYPVNVEYEDTRIFQIVCPCCKEPVFKVSRENAFDYFSHYKKDETLIDQCELRVNRISKQEINDKKYESRNQKLYLFLKEFQDIVWENEYDDNSRKKAKRLCFQFNKSSIFVETKLKFLEYYRDFIEDKNNLFNMFHESIENMIYKTEFFNTDFAVNIQKEYAYDFLQYLLAGHSKTNFFFLFNHAFILLHNEFKNNYQKQALNDYETTLFMRIDKICNTENEKKRVSVFREMVGHSVFTSNSNDVINGYIVFGARMLQHSFSILLRIPYLKILKERLSNKEVGGKKISVNSQVNSPLGFILNLDLY